MTLRINKIKEIQINKQNIEDSKDSEFSKIDFIKILDNLSPKNLMLKTVDKPLNIETDMTRLTMPSFYHTFSNMDKMTLTPKDIISKI